MELHWGPLYREFEKDHHYSGDGKCLGCIHMPHRGGEQLCSENIRSEHVWLGVNESYRHSRGSHVLGSTQLVEYTLRVKHTQKDCTVVYGDRRGIANAMTVLDAGAVRGL